jgi:hypothetical protein
MPRLAGTEIWPLPQVNRQISFLRACAEKHREMSIRLRGLGTASEEVIAFLDEHTDRGDDGLPARFLMRAADFAFVTGNTEDGMELLRQAFASLMGATIGAARREPGGLKQFTLLAAITALLYRDAIRVTATQMTLQTDQSQVSFFWESTHDPRELAAVLPLLLTTSIISQSSAEGVAAFLSNQELPRAVLLGLSAAEASPTFALLGYHRLVYDNEVARRRFAQLNRDDGYGGLRELERSYSLRIELLRRDSYNWKAMRPRVELIDWPYLLAYMALVRDKSRTPKEIGKEDSLPPPTFIEQLATELALREQ